MLTALPLLSDLPGEDRIRITGGKPRGYILNVDTIGRAVK
jgi:hypothetical protein